MSRLHREVSKTSTDPDVGLIGIVLFMAMLCALLVSVAECGAHADRVQALERHIKVIHDHCGFGP